MTENYKAKAFPRAVLELDLQGLKKNCKVLKAMSPEGAFFCPMVKANAYGHGAVPVARALMEEGIRQVGVISVSEAWQIREFVSESLDILVFGPVLNREDLSWGLESRLVFVLNNWPDLEALAQKKAAARAHLKFDTGFSRLGFALSEAEKLKAFLDRNPQIQLEGLASQLIAGEEIGDESSFSRRQMERFLSLKKIFPSLPLHLLNTSAMLSAHAHDMRHQIGSRPGIGLYGLKPRVFFANKQSEKKAERAAFEPASRLKSHVAAFRRLKAGGRVSYSGEWKAPRPSDVIAVAMGYGDGFFRGSDPALGARRILFRGQKAPIVGRVCMDFFMADVTECLKGDQPPVSLGEEVALFGRQGAAFLSVEEQSQRAGTIPYELLARLGDRVQRNYLS